METLSKHAPLKMEMIQGNHNLLSQKKKMRKAIMKRLALKKSADISNNPEIKKII